MSVGITGVTTQPMYPVSGLVWIQTMHAPYHDPQPSCSHALSTLTTITKLMTVNSILLSKLAHVHVHVPTHACTMHLCAVWEWVYRVDTNTINTVYVFANTFRDVRVQSYGYCGSSLLVWLWQLVSTVVKHSVASIALLLLQVGDQKNTLGQGYFSCTYHWQVHYKH